MKKTILVAALLVGSSAIAGECVDGQWVGTYAGPGSTPPDCTQEVIPPDSGFTTPVSGNALCFPDGCSAIAFTWVGLFRVAQSTLPNGYPVLGFSGPCLNYNGCDEIDVQAESSLFWNARQAHRAQRYQP